MGVSYREEIRRREKGQGKTADSREQVRLSRTRARDRKEYFRKSHAVHHKKAKTRAAPQMRMF